MERVYIKYLRTEAEPERRVDFRGDYETRKIVARALQAQGFNLKGEITGPTVTMMRPARPPQPYGVVVLGAEGRFGWALANTKADNFNYARAKQIAFGRAACRRDKPAVLPSATAVLLQQEKEKAFAWLEKVQAGEKA